MLFFIKEMALLYQTLRGGVVMNSKEILCEPKQSLTA